MLSIHIEKIGNMAIVECRGRLVQDDAAFKLRDVVMSQLDSRTIVIDLTDVYAIEGGGLGMLSVLQKWADSQPIQLVLFNPISSVRNRLEHNDPAKFRIVGFEEMMTILAAADPPPLRRNCRTRRPPEHSPRVPTRAGRGLAPLSRPGPATGLTPPTAVPRRNDLSPTYSKINPSL